MGKLYANVRPIIFVWEQYITMRNDKQNGIDATDKAILGLLQHNGDMPVAEIAEQVGLTVTPCWRRIQKLEEKGIISKRVALLQARQLGLTTVSYTHLTLPTNREV